MAGWNSAGGPGKDGLWVEWERGSGSLAQVRHPGYEWLDTIPKANRDKKAQTAAIGYLNALAELTPPLDKGVRDAIAVLGEPTSSFGWLPITWGLRGVRRNTNPNASYLLTRVKSGGDWLEASLVLLAARRLDGKALGDGVGLRVTAHVKRGDGDVWDLRFTSVVGSRLDEAGVNLPGWLARECDGAENVDKIREALKAALDVEQVAVHAVHAVHTIQGDTCTLEGLAARRRSGEKLALKLARARAFGFSVEVNLITKAVTNPRIRELSSRMQVNLFERDPASLGPARTLHLRRPSAAMDALDACREYRVTPPNPDGRGQSVPLVDHPRRRFFVTHERANAVSKDGIKHAAGKQSTALLPARPSPATSSALPDHLQYLPLRSDDLAAAQAFLRGKDLFDRLDVYGFDEQEYFRHALLPLELRPRARLQGASDGRTVNAEVRPFFRNSGHGIDMLSRTTKLKLADMWRPQLLVRLGSADTKVRQGAQTLGLAADPRWAWHEFGHVLNFAATGELEFAFAHSAGDALAAIVADPDSHLAVDENLRGYTFPWAFVPRRHDREALQGYCWCGRRSQWRLEPNQPVSHYQHGYFEEQLLSSSLFRLYRCLGGDTGERPEKDLTPDQLADRTVRRSASDYCVYLIMRAIALGGPNGIAPSRTPEQFVGALIDADLGTGVSQIDDKLGTGVWKINAPWPYREGIVREVRRHGGLVHKVIRWAFEQQGLYAPPADSSGDVAERPGLAPEVDVYIGDRRDAEGGPSNGGYVPVALRWDPLGQAPWHAHTDAIGRDSKDSKKKLTVVRVGQRGLRSVPGPDLHLRLWVSAANDAPLAWQRVDANSVDAGVVDGEFTKFTADLSGYTGPRWVLASVHTAGDPSNLPLNQPKPPVTQTDLIELVAHDNNIGLAYLG